MKKKCFSHFSKAPVFQYSGYDRNQLFISDLSSKLFTSNSTKTDANCTEVGRIK